MERWLPRRPLILAPLIPLIWTVSWLGGVTIRHAFGFDYPNPGQLQDSVLIILALVVLSNIYNLALIYQQTEKYQNVPQYSRRAFLLAIILIISIILAWGQPKRILIPNRLTIGVIAYIILNCGQAMLTTYFVQLSRPVTRRKRASLLLPVGELALAGFLTPFIFNHDRSWQIAVLGCGLLVIFTIMQWNNIAGVFSLVPAVNSGFYQMMIGVNLTTILSTIFFGLDTFVIMIINDKLSLIAACFAQSLILVGVTGLVIAAMQRYDNDYRYGHAAGNEITYLLAGILFAVGILLLSCWTLVK